MLRNDFPILEFDEDISAFIRPADIVQQLDISERCVLCFFSESIEKIIKEYPCRIAGSFRAESLRLPVYELDYKGEKIVLIQAGVGAPVAAAQIEELAAMGCKKFVACGSCGVLEKSIAIGHLIIPTSAVRDEGTSYHYIKPSREIEADKEAARVVEETLRSKGVAYIKAKTWTTDAFYRETSEKIRRRREEGCVTVEMETAAYIAVARYNGVSFGQILYAGDNLGGDIWDSRDFNKRTDIRDYVLELAIEACLNL